MKKAIIQFLVFGVGGVVNFFLNTYLTYFLTETIGLYYLYAFILVQIVVVIYGYLYNSFLTFGLKKVSPKVIVRFVFSLIVFAIMNILLVKILTDWCQLYYVFSIVVTIFITIIGRFLFYRKYVFVED